MAQPITDYAAFFAGAKQAVQELEQLKTREKQLEEKEAQLEASLKAKQKAVSDTVSQTVKKRRGEIAKSYDGETAKTQERLKKVRAKREKAKSQGVKERISESTENLVKENKDLKKQVKDLFHAKHVPGYCSSNLYYSLYFTRGLKEMGCLLLVLLLIFAALPCGIYFAIPERKTWYLVLIYVADILIFGGIYIKIGNYTKIRYMDALKEGRALRDRMRSNKKSIRAIAKTIRKDKNEAGYNLEKYDDELAQLDQDLAEINRKKKEALNTFDTVTKTIISDEIIGNHQTEINGLENELSETNAALRSMRAGVKEKSMYIADNYESYTGKDFITVDKLNALEDIIKNGRAANISEAITVFKAGNYTSTQE